MRELEQEILSLKGELARADKDREICVEAIEKNPMNSAYVSKVIRLEGYIYELENTIADKEKELEAFDYDFEIAG